jgi:rubrerythrin
MDIRLFLTTFALIFLAELGDKTQLASMAASAGSKSPWSVFAGAAAALVFSTLLATLLGATLQRYLPQHYLRGGAAILFFLFGAILLVSAFRVTREAAPTPPRKPGVLGRLVTAAAADFERASAMDYEKLAAQSVEPRLRELFLHLASEEREHIGHLRSTDAAMSDMHLESGQSKPAEVLSEKGAPPTGEPGREVLNRAIQHERDTAAFYRTLARTAPLPGARAVFIRLAREEESHVAHLIEYRDSGSTDVSRDHA